MEVLRQIRRRDEKHRYSILILTGIEDDLEVAKALEAGVDDYLTKPFGMAGWKPAFARLLQKR